MLSTSIYKLDTIDLSKFPFYNIISNQYNYDIKSYFTDSDTKVIIDTSITGKKLAIKKHQIALEKNEFEHSQIAIISKQLNTIGNTLTKIKARKLS